MKILLIRLRLIGDVVFTTPAIRALARAVPGAHLTFLVEAEAAPVVAGNPHLKEVLVVRRRRGLARLRDDLVLASRIRAARFDAVIDFHGGPRGAWLTWASGAPVRIGYSGRGRGWMYTQRVDRSGLRTRHCVENQWDLLARICGSLGRPPEPGRDRVEMTADPAVVATVDRRLAGAQIEPDHRIIVLHVSAGNPFRRWPAEYFVDLAASLAAADPRRRIVVVSGPSDASVAAHIRNAARSRLGAGGDAIVGGEDFNLAELRAVIERSALFIGGDSGPLHVAATTRAPVVGIYGPTLPARSAPWRDPECLTESVDVGSLPCRPCDQRRCDPGDFRCLARLAPTAVIAAAERALERFDAQHYADRRPARGSVQA